MKNLLLASTALVALAGVAAAEGHLGVTFDGSAEIGFNDDSGPAVGPNSGSIFSADDDNQGFYGTVDLGVGFAAELDNGVTAAVEFDIEFEDGTSGDLSFDDALLSLTSETASMYFGVTTFAAESLWTSAGDMEGDAFSEASDEIVLKGVVMYGNVEAALSYVVADDAGTSVSDIPGSTVDADQLSIGLVGTFGNFTVGAAYQDDADAVTSATGNGDFEEEAAYGLFASTSFSGADVTLAYAERDNLTEDSSIGIKVAYPLGPVTATAYYVVEDDNTVGGPEDNWGINLAYENGPIGVALDFQDDQGTEKVGLEGSYDIGNGLMMYAGYLTQDVLEDRFYVAATYDLGSGAEILVSYAEDDDNEDEDEIGAGEYQRGTTVELSFEF